MTRVSIVTTPGHQQGGVQLPRNGWSKVRSWLLEAWKWHHSPGDSRAVVRHVFVNVCKVLTCGRPVSVLQKWFKKPVWLGVNIYHHHKTTHRLWKVVWFLCTHDVIDVMLGENFH